MYQIHLKLGNGNVINGFPSVTADFLIDKKITASITGCLESNAKLYNLYQEWQTQYRDFCTYYSYSRAISISCSATLGSLSLNDFKESIHSLRYEFNKWLDSNSLQAIKEYIIKFINLSKSVRIVIHTNNLDLCKLPWDSWSLLEEYPDLEFSFSGLNHQPIKDLKKIARKTIPNQRNILIVLGNHQKTPLVDADAALIENWSESNTKTLKSPSLTELHEKLLSEPWDIVYFAGHSTTVNSKGVILLNDREAISMEDLKPTLERSVASGLQLAIFNSCDGLGMAFELAKISLPFSIIMREPIPDAFAHRFLMLFFKHFTDGDTLHVAVRMAQRELQAYEFDFPSITSLPLVFENSDVTSLTWKSLKPAKIPDKNFSNGVAKFRRFTKRFYLIKNCVFLAIILQTIIIGIMFKPTVINLILDKKDRSLSLGTATDSNFSFLKSSKSLANDAKINILSKGDKILLSNKNSRLIKAIEYFSNKEFINASRQFRLAWRADITNPEPLIYYNNSLAHDRQSFYTIAVVVPIEDREISSQQILRGVAMAQHEFNQSAGDDSPLLQVIIVREFQEDLSAAKSVASMIAQDQNILGVLGHFSSNSIKAALPEYNKQDLPFISSGNASELNNNNSILFTTVPSNSARIKQFISYTESSKSKKIAIFYNSKNSYSKEFKNEILVGLSDNERSEYSFISHDLSDLNSSFDLYLAKLAFAGFDTGLILSSSIDIPITIELIKANKALPAKRQLNLIGDNTLYQSEILVEGGVTAKGLNIVGIPWNPDSPESLHFQEKSIKLWGGNVNWRTATSYDSTKALLKTFKPNISRSEVLASLPYVKLKMTETSGRIISFEGSSENLLELYSLKAKNFFDEDNFGLGFQYTQYNSQKNNINNME